MRIRAVSSTTVTVDRVASIVVRGESRLVRPDARGPGEESLIHRRLPLDAEFPGNDA